MINFYLYVMMWGVFNMDTMNYLTLLKTIICGAGMTVYNSSVKIVGIGGFRVTTWLNMDLTIHGWPGSGMLSLMSENILGFPSP